MSSGSDNVIGLPIPEHLREVARTWEQILSELHPEHAWVVEFRQVDAADAERLAAAAVRAIHYPGAPADDTDPIPHGNHLPTAGALDKHALDEAA